MKHFIAFLLLIGVYFLSTPISQGMPSDSGINTENAKPARICFKIKGEKICIKIKVNVELNLEGDPDRPILTGSLVDGALVISGFSEDDNGVTFSIDNPQRIALEFEGSKEAVVAPGDYTIINEQVSLNIRKPRKD